MIIYFGSAFNSTHNAMEYSLHFVFSASYPVLFLSIFFHYSTKKCIINWEIDGLNNHGKKTNKERKNEEKKKKNLLIFVLKHLATNADEFKRWHSNSRLNVSNDRHYYNYRAISIVWTAKKRQPLRLRFFFFFISQLVSFFCVFFFALSILLHVKSYSRVT